jgi:hypothetical protein
MSRLPEAYPDAPGFKAPGPSEQAATAISSTAKTLRDQVLETIAKAPAGLSADAVAERLCKSVLSVRPRVSETVLTIAFEHRVKLGQTGVAF